MSSRLKTAQTRRAKEHELAGSEREFTNDYGEGSRRFIELGRENGVDFIAASFVRKGSDIDYIRSVLGDAASKISIISKVENMEGLDNFEDIVDKSDGVMVARGDLGMEIRMEQIFLAQKRMIKRCNEAGKPVITATQMLESMTGAPLIGRRGSDRRCECHFGRYRLRHVVRRDGCG